MRRAASRGAILAATIVAMSFALALLAGPLGSPAFAQSAGGLGARFVRVTPELAKECKPHLSFWCAGHRLDRRRGRGEGQHCLTRQDPIFASLLDRNPAIAWP